MFFYFFSTFFHFYENYKLNVADYGLSKCDGHHIFRDPVLVCLGLCGAVPYAKTQLVCGSV